MPYYLLPLATEQATKWLKTVKLLKVGVENTFAPQNENPCKKTIIHQPLVKVLGLQFGENVTTIGGQTAVRNKLLKSPVDGKGDRQFRNYSCDYDVRYQ